MAAPSPPSRLMLVVSKNLPGVTIYDACTEEPLCRATMGISPHEAAFSADGRVAYVPVYGSTGVGKPGTNEHVIHFVRTSDGEIVSTLDTHEYKRPHGIVVGHSGILYVTTEIAESVILIDPRERRIIATIPTGSQTSHMIAVTADEKTIYVSNVQSKTVSVLDVKHRTLAETIPTGCDNQRMTLSPDERWFVTSLGPDHKIAFYRTSDNQLDFTIPIEGVPFVAKFSADGKYLYDVGHRDGQIRVWKIDVAQQKVVAVTTEDLGKDAGSLEVNPFNRQVYVTDQVTSKISELDPDTWKITKQLATDQRPDCMVFAIIR